MTSPTKVPVTDSPTNYPIKVSITDAPVVPVPQLTTAPITPVQPTNTPLIPTSAPSLASLVKYILVDSDTNADLVELSQTTHTMVNVVAYGAQNFNVYVTGANGAAVSYVSFTSPSSRTERKAPFAYCGDSGGDYYACGEFVIGSHTIESTAMVNGFPYVTAVR